jgi:hypothetical protein
MGKPVLRTTMWKKYKEVDDIKVNLWKVLYEYETRLNGLRTVFSSGFFQFLFISSKF